MQEGEKMDNMWDILYDLYCHVEERHISHIVLYEDEEKAEICFSEDKCDPTELKKIKKFLGPKCGDYSRFLEFYNGMTLGQWHFFAPDDPDFMVMEIYNYEIVIRENTASDIKDKMLPIAIDNADHYTEKTNDNLGKAKDVPLNIRDYCISKTGAIFSLPSMVSIRDKAELEQEPVLISHSFQEFMTECVLGPRYLEFCEEDATYRFLRQFLKNHTEVDAETLKEFGSCNDRDRNPTRDPRIMTGLMEEGRDLARQTYEQTKDLPAGTPIDFE
jgi:hypothetical protein